MTLQVRCLVPEALDADDHARWVALARESGGHSVFAEPWFMRSSLAHCRGDKDVQLAVVEDECRRWIGTMPITPSDTHGRLPMPHVRVWRHPNQFKAPLLVRRDEASAFWAAMLEGLARLHPHRVALSLDQLPRDDCQTQALLDLCDRQRRKVVIDRIHERPILFGCMDASQPQPSAKHRARIRSLARRIERELGPLAMEVTRDADEIAARCDVFLALEASGWKGRAGSALSSCPETEAFFRSTLTEGAKRGAFELAQLRAGGQTIAITTMLIGPRGRYGFKSAFDEQYASFGPGAVLLARYTDYLMENGAEMADSCCDSDGQPVARLWPRRREFVDLRLPIGGLRRTAFHSLTKAQALRAKFRPAQSDDSVSPGG